MEKRRLAILGSTGSIGKQALDVVSQHSDLFQVEVLTANNSSELLIEQAIRYDVNNVVICNEKKYKEVADALQPHGIKRERVLGEAHGRCRKGRTGSVL